MARILVADDDALSMENIVSTLEGDGHEVLCEYDGQSAYDVALNEQPDLVVIAINLPIFNGLETCDLLRNDPEIPRDLPIVLLVSNAIDSRKVDNVGASAVLEKGSPTVQMRDLMIELLGDKI